MRIKTTTILAAALLAALALAAHAQDAAPAGRPDQPVAKDALAPEALNAFTAPLEAEVTRQALHARKSPAASFTSGLNLYHQCNAINHYQGGFEPMAFRPKFRAETGDWDTVHLNQELAHNFREGFVDGSRVRVYQAIDGKLVKIRDTQVAPGGHHASGWMDTRGQLTTLKGKTNFRLKFDSSFLPNRDYWFSVQAVDDFYQFSEPSNAASAHSPDECKGQEDPEPYPGWQNFDRDNPGKPAPPPAPKNFKVTQDGPILQFSWDEADAPRLRGYRLLVSAFSPAKQKGFGLKLAGREPRPDRPIQKDDIVFLDCIKYELNAGDRSPYVHWPAVRQVGSPFSCDVYFTNPYGIWSDGADGYPAHWRYVKHPAPVPAEFAGGGDTCLEWSCDTDAVTGFPLTPYGSKNDAWYPALAPGEYKVEAWVRGSGKANIIFVGGPFCPRDVPLPYKQWSNGKPELAVPPVELPLSGQWTKVTGSFTVKDYFNEGLGWIMLCLQGPGKIYVDNLRIYNPAYGYGELSPHMTKELGASGTRFARFIELVNSRHGYTMEAATGDAVNITSGGRVRPNSMHSLLNILKRAGGKTSPWLQIEMCMDEAEWLGFVEWFCAPYDPKKGDTPQKKPWAYKRWSMGQQRPWIDEFPEFGFEISNETWNQTFKPYDWDWGRSLTDGADGRRYSFGATYGLFNEYVLGILRSSPYWTPEVEKKALLTLCGWSASIPFGVEAARHSPSAETVTCANYVHNQGLGDPKMLNDFKRFYIMQWPISGYSPNVAKQIDGENRLRAEGRQIESGIYEYGYAYFVMPYDPAEGKSTDQGLARSMIGAVAVLDSTLTGHRLGLGNQNFFTFGPSIGAWGSHTLPQFGGPPYPLWKGLALYNQHGSGGYCLDVKTSKVPTWSFPAYKTEDNMHEATRAALPNAPLVSVHAYAKEDRVTVFLISRKLDNFPVAGDDGYTLATVKLPFAKARKITLHKLAGNPRADDRFEEVHKVETLDIDPNSFAGKLDVNGKTGADPRGLPPASIFCYVFEGAGIGQADPPPVARFELPETIVAGEPASLKGTSGDGLTHAWNFGPAGESSEFNPSVTFPEAGMVEIALTVANAKGLSNTLKRANCPVGVRFGGEVWKPWSNDPGKGKGPRARLETDGTLALIGTSPAAAQGRYSLLRAEPIFGKGFILEAVIAKVEGQGNDPRIAGGLALAANPRVGLGFSFDDLEQLITPASIFVAPDGAVRKLTGQGEQLDELLPAGSLAFPAKLRLAVKDGQAVASVETGGAWKEVATFALPDDIGLMPALAVGSPNGNAKTTMTVSTIKITDDNK